MYYCYIITTILLISRTINGAPRILNTDYEKTDLSTINNLKYKISEPDPSSISSTNTNTQSTGNGILQFFGKFLEKNDIVSSLMNMVSKLGQKSIDDEKYKLYGQEYIEKEKYTSRNNVQLKNTAQSAREVQLDQPIPLSNDNFNIDTRPETVNPSDVQLPKLDNEWKSTLFGPKGLLTEVFHFVNEKRKQEFVKATASPQQSDLPVNSDVDFGKVLDAFLKSDNGNFDDPKIPELPFIGICNRLSCGDIYRAIDQFKKSEMFSNFQTAVSLIQDPKGWDIIGEVLENPELIEQFTGKPDNIAEIFGKVGGETKKKGNSHSMSILPSDGDLGIDFGSEIDPPKGPTKEAKPDIALSVDGSDYYSAVNKEDTKEHPDYDYVDSVDVEEAIPVLTTTITPATKKVEPPLPELSFSVDEGPEIAESVDSMPEYGSSVAIEESVPVLPKSGDSRKLTAMERRFFIPTTTTVVQTTTTPIKTTAKIPTTTRRIFTTTTKKNFRKNNDYYSMYYDN